MIQLVMKIMLLLWVLKTVPTEILIAKILITKDHLSVHTVERAHILVIQTIHMKVIIVVVIVRIIHQFMNHHLFKAQFQDKQQVNKKNNNNNK